MRIRTVKPEFWRSEDITALTWHDRLLFIGLWSYVDDNGVGVDKLHAIAADLFAGDLMADARETFARVSRGLQTLSEAGLITRYLVDGKPLLHVTSWDKHQRIDRPGKPRYEPPTCDNAQIRAVPATPSGDSRETPSTGTGEQGNRGTGEETLPPPAARPGAITSQTVVGTWVDAMRSNGTEPSKRMIGEVARTAKDLLEHNDPDRVNEAARQAGLAGYTTIDRQLAMMNGRSLKVVGGQDEIDVNPWITR